MEFFTNEPSAYWIWIIGLIILLLGLYSFDMIIKTGRSFSYFYEDFGFDDYVSKSSISIYGSYFVLFENFDSPQEIVFR